MERIPFFEQVYDVYTQEVYTPFRAAAVHGAYYPTYLISLNLRLCFDRSQQPVVMTCLLQVKPIRRSLILSDVSEIFRLSRLNAMTFLKGGSWKEVVGHVAIICSTRLMCAVESMRKKKKNCSANC
ncbi:hypothetical protein F443_09472 [Phytophthora nicotianae P1569]|uniref:Uncharacterized protein n=2 Tax=Phytophthora nicotianae TaxID=4792 RepID=V9F6W8_PHYNI|nr:hypothetical protein F443_09472 [Phytophthora nicotianae P1569]ETO74792.1 hypothetical protein F444_09542 [Phytophthora nicotianae P1976]